MRRIAACIAGALMGLTVAGSGHAQQFPSKPINLVIPSTPGGLTDAFGRIIGDAMTKAWGQPVILEHRAGANGIIGTNYVAKAEPDGHTLLLGSAGPLATNEWLYSSVPYSSERDFAGVGMVVTFPNVLVVNPSLPINNVQELIAYAKANPGKLNYGSAGIGASHHLSGELFRLMTGADIVHVPYKGTAPALADLLGGHVQMMFSNVPAAVGHIQSKALRPLAVTSTARNPALPDIPTIAEAGVPGYSMTSWVILVAPAKTPPEIVAKLNAEVVKAMNTPEARERLVKEGGATSNASPKEMDEFLKGENAKFRKIVKDANLKAD
ncbi:MAG: Bug family tripartite tricarboxylate transporter substrate binding protein [Reyranellaceae bacterium]